MNIRQVETSVRNAVKLILSELEDKYIRFAYAPNGQPAFFPSENVIFVWAEESRDDYGRQSETVAEYSSETDSERLARSRTIVYSVHFIAYGPDSSENINRIKSGMLNESVRRSFLLVVFFIFQGWTRLPVSMKIMMVSGGNDGTGRRNLTI